MGNKTSIEWVISPNGSQGCTVNPIRFRNLETGKIGHHCEKISPGCKNCYASTMQKPYLSGLDFVAENRAKGDFFLDQAALESVLRRRVPTTYFWCDMTDMFGRWVPRHWLDQIWGVMLDTPQHRHIVLTKRSRELLDYLTAETVGGGAHHGTPPDWIIVGVSCEDRKSLSRLDHLRATPAVCRIVSFEPLLEDLGTVNLDGIGWAIVGGESGPGARPMHPDWARSLRDQCTAAGVPFFLKQQGEWQFGSSLKRNDDRILLNDGTLLKANAEDATAEQRNNWPAYQPHMVACVGKKDAGRLLDGREWNERPEVLR